MGSVLRCVEGPAVGGDTIWVNMVEAYKPSARAHQDADRRTCAPGTASRRPSAPRMPIEQRHALQGAVPRRRAPGRAHPPGDRREGAVRQRLHDPLHQLPHRRERPLRPRLQPRRQRAAQLPDPPGRHPRVPGPLALDERTASRSGTTAAPSTTPSRTTGPPSARWSAPGSSATRPSDHTPPTHTTRTENHHALPRRRPLPRGPGEAGHHRRAVRPRVGAGGLPRGPAADDGRARPAGGRLLERRRHRAAHPRPRARRQGLQAAVEVQRAARPAARGRAGHDPAGRRLDLLRPRGRRRGRQVARRRHPAHAGRARPQARPGHHRDQHQPDEHRRADDRRRHRRHLVRASRGLRGLPRDVRPGRPELGRGAPASA